VIGYPNVGKSATINRILGRKRVKSADTPGVTRSLQWVKVKTTASASAGVGGTAELDKTFELLDSPGIIEADLIDQNAAMLLAACNSIGPKAYDNQRVAAFLIDWIVALEAGGWERVYFPDFCDSAKQRYGGVDVFADGEGGGSMSGEDVLHTVAYNTCKGDLENASLKILQDFRNGRLGEICLQVAPKQDKKFESSSFAGDTIGLGGGGTERGETAEEREKIEAKRKAAKEELASKNIELPDVAVGGGDNDNDSGDSDNDNVGLIGKGKFDGW